MTDAAEQELFESLSKDVKKLDEDEAEVELVKEPVVEEPADEVKPEPKPKKAKVKKSHVRHTQSPTARQSEARQGNVLGQETGKGRGQKRSSQGG